MESRLLMVKEKLFQLKQEQLRHKVMFNIVAFDSHVKAWRDALVDVSEENLRQAWDWVRVSCSFTQGFLFGFFFIHSPFGISSIIFGIFF